MESKINEKELLEKVEQMTMEELKNLAYKMLVTREKTRLRNRKRNEKLKNNKNISS